jgi:transcriptional regulator with XRE-family HTH domain
MNIGRKIIKYRQLATMTQAELGGRIGVDQETIFNWENNLEFPNEKQIAALARALNVAFYELNSYDEKKEAALQDSVFTNTDEIFKKYLNYGEQIKWSGKPKYLSSITSFPIKIFGLFFLGFAIFWTIMTFEVMIGMSFFGIPFIIIGAFLVFGNKFKKFTSQRQKYYAVTSERIIIITVSSQEEKVDVGLDRLTNVVLSPGLNGTNTIVFYTRNSYGVYSSHPYFYNIENGQQVVDLINKLKSNRQS